ILGELVIASNIIEAIKTGAAPPPARLAAARGLLPLSNEESLEVLVALSSDENEEVRSAASSTLDTLEPASFAALAADRNTSSEVLGFLCLWARAPREVVEAAVFNSATPDAALARLAAQAGDGSIIEAISLKQQSLIRTPEIIEAILANPTCTPEADRRAREVRQEFFEKQFGAQMVAQEQRARAEAEEIARETVTIEGIDDLVRLGLIEEGIDDSIFTDYEMEYGPFDPSPPPEEQLDVEQLISQVEQDEGEMPPERLPVFQRIALMSIKDRVMLAMKGTREARMILVRDPNRIVAGAVLRNPRMTETEIESISSIKTVPEDVLRQIGQNRVWARSYIVIHNLVRNPRTPISLSLGFLNRILTRDLKALSTNKNIPDVIRTTAARLYIKRGGA
ncbi:MAG TPA: hypothetical protein VLD57_05485, partial [Blastocatellia bacterium]|nr:hypothetical protein [Blastocatellia bacterium]